MASQKQKHQFSHHQPVLLEDTVAQLSPSKGESYLDLTAGYGGHATKIIDITKAPAKAMLVDRDPYATEKLRELFADRDEPPQIINSTYLDVVAKLDEEGKRFDMILMDLGISSPQVDIAERGFSFAKDGPLDMRMGSSETTAADIVNESSMEQLTDILKKYGQEPFARTIAQHIVDKRPYFTTLELAESINIRVGRKGKLHPATRTFQALRIAVNEELTQLTQALPQVTRLLNPGGRVVVISFHSLEDRIVKSYFRQQSQAGYEAELTILTKRPIQGDINDVFNPRARSAKLRAAVKINTHQK